MRHSGVCARDFTANGRNKGTAGYYYGGAFGLYLYLKQKPSVRGLRSAVGEGTYEAVSKELLNC